MHLIILASGALPLVMAVVMVVVLVKIFSPAGPRAVVLPGPGQMASLHALLMPDSRPGTIISLDQWRAPSGRIILSAHELIWVPDDPGQPSWRAPLHQVWLVERPSLATGRLTVSVHGRMFGLVVDEKKRPNRFSRNTVADLRQARTGAWFADLIDAAARQAHACTARVS